MTEKVITRYPPSPTGFVHIGSVRTALFNYLFAAHQGGNMVLRFEDTDRERSKKEFEADILAGLVWLNIPYTTPTVARQSERTAVYQKYIPTLIAAGKAYEAEASKENPDKKVVRFKNPNTKITFTDQVRGEVTFDTTELGDFVIARTIDEPLYHLAVVIDDHEMEVTHVIRGEDHISNTPRQILILEALGFRRPYYAHIPLILAPDKTKLSKRHGAVSINEYRAQGFIPEAILNYLALLGWNPGGEQELFSLVELVEKFSLERVHKAGAIFGIEKLKWFNHEHLKKLSDTEYAARVSAFTGHTLDARLIPLLKERAQTLQEASTMLETELSFLGAISYEPALLLNRGKISAEVASSHLTEVARLIQGVTDDAYTSAQLKETLWPYATEKGRGEVLWPLRVALSGKERSPDPFTLAGILGKQETLNRIAQALRAL